MEQWKREKYLKEKNFGRSFTHVEKYRKGLESSLKNFSEGVITNASLEYMERDFKYRNLHRNLYGNKST
jgi:hypothetical protein